MSKRFAMVVFGMFLGGCVATVPDQANRTQESPQEDAGADATPDARPDASEPTPNPFLVDGPQMPANWQCLTCTVEGRSVYACGFSPDAGALEEACPNGSGPALSPSFAGCVGVWQNAQGACLVPGEAGAASLLVMCGPDSDDVGMVCQ